ncbi:MAG: HlyD family secretion protein, partial [Spirochaetes bacterium]|nr:HlyD family secretion protein [Spirochaetota bacterium]
KKVENLEEELALFKKKISVNNIIDYKLYSKMQNGLVDELNVTPGSYVDIETTLFTLLELETLYITADIPEEFIKDIKPEAKAEVIPVADKSLNYPGKVTKVSGIAHENNGETVIAIEIELDEYDDFLLPNFNVDVKIYY